MSQIWTIAETHPVPPCTVVIFGASGDLAARKLLPALYNLEHCGQEAIPPKSAILGFARREMSTEAFRTKAREAAERYSRLKIDEACWQRFANNLDYLSGMDRPDGFARLKSRLEEIERKRGLPPNRIYYLSVPPEAITETVAKLHEAGLIAPAESPHFTRIVVEKPIGHDLHSALHIISSMRKFFAESQIFRIDHYLGKETVQNLMVLRFANSIFEPLWNNRRVDHVQITVAEDEGVGTRAMYYDGAGALRDMVQNHMLQLRGADRDGTAGVARRRRRARREAQGDRSLRPIDGRERAQAGGARPIRRRANSAANRFPATCRRKASRDLAHRDLRRAKALVDNWRWAGVPFYLRTGKRLPRRASTIFVQFKRVPEILFNRRVAVIAGRADDPDPARRRLLARGARQAARLDITIQPVRMDLHYAASSATTLPTPTSVCCSTSWRATIRCSWDPVSSSARGNSSREFSINGRPTREFPWSLTRPEPGGLRQPTI